MKTIKLFVLLAASAFLFACGSSDNGSSSSSGPAGTATFKSNGGSAFVNLSTAGGATGGSGGSVYIDVYGDVKVTSGGSVDTSFTVPTYNSNYGPKKATISSNTAVTFLNVSTSLAATTLPPSGGLYVLADDSTLYESTGTAGVPVTGLEVKSGATLTLPANYTYNPVGQDNTGYSQHAVVYFDQSVTIDGTVKPEAEVVSLNISSGSLLQVGTTGKVTTKPATAGVTAGFIYLYGEVAVNKGVIDASGSDGSPVAIVPPELAKVAALSLSASEDGGAGGGVDFEADSFLYNTGTILSKGGASTLAAGGKGRHIHLYAYSSSLFTSGTIDNSGGNGKTYGGSAGYNIRLEGGSDDIGSVIASGSILNNGGNGGTGNGGNSVDGIYLDSNGGKVWSSATISAKGGGSTAANGGSGGDIDLYGDYGYDYGNDNAVETQGIKLSGNIDLSGGNGATSGGSGGELYVENDYSYYGLLPTPAVELVGFASLTMDGGAGVYGGSGGYYEINTDAYWTSDDYFEVPVGSIENQAAFSAKGGAGSMTASNGYGGHGGYVDFDCYNDSSLLTTITTSNSGAIDISGGDGNYAGGGGYIWMYGYGKLTNSGAINAKGGKGSTEGGHSDYVDLYSSFDVVNSGAIEASGGSGITGGSAADVELYAGGQTRNSGAITVTGGAGTTLGGNGGTIDLFSEMLPTSNSGSLKVTKGAGGTTAVDGWIWIDWVDVGLVHDSNPT